MRWVICTLVNRLHPVTPWAKENSLQNATEMWSCQLLRPKLKCIYASWIKHCSLLFTNDKTVFGYDNALVLVANDCGLCEAQIIIYDTLALLSAMYLQHYIKHSAWSMMLLSDLVIWFLQKSGHNPHSLSIPTPDSDCVTVWACRDDSERWPTCCSQTSWVILLHHFKMPGTLVNVSSLTKHSGSQDTCKVICSYFRGCGYLLMHQPLLSAVLQLSSLWKSTACGYIPTICPHHHKR